MTEAKTRLQHSLGKLSKLHFIYLLFFGLSLLAYNAWELLTPEALRGYWIVFSIILLALAYVWQKAEKAGKSPSYYKRLAGLLITADIVLAAFVVFAQR